MSEKINPEDAAPFHLMPLAALLGSYTLLGTLRILYIFYKSYKHQPSSLTPPPPSLLSRSNLLFYGTVLISFFGYGYIVARVQSLHLALQGPFNPYEILKLEEGCSNTTLVKSAYRSLSKLHHPDKGGDKAHFQQIHLAYKALTDDESRRNWEMFGHPDGKQMSPTLSFALPDWLLRPEGSVAAILVLLYLGLFLGIIMYVIRYVRTSKPSLSTSNSVASADADYLIRHLSYDLTHMDILFLIATTPENISQSQANLQQIQQLQARKRAELSEQRKKTFDLDLSGDWADDEDEDGNEEEKERRLKAKQEEEEKIRHQAQLNQATGKINVLEMKLEGIDEGVLGQQWVQTVLAQKGHWPPKNIPLIKKFETKGVTWNVDGKVVSGNVLEIPAIKRNLIMTIGRLNSQLLNTHPDLTNATQKKLIDSTYFKSSIEFRQRAGLLLEAALRIAASAKSYPLAKTIIETVTLFKIGTSSIDITWFHQLLKNQYGVIPQLTIEEKNLETEGEEELATGDTSALKLSMDRLHAEGFTRGKIAMAQKQGLPPQALLQTYQEGWWILIRAEKIAELDGSKYNTPMENYLPEPKGMENLLTEQDLKRCHSGKEKDVLLACWPSIVTNVAQKKGKIKVNFKAPSVPGKYRFYVDLKSQEFLGCDVEFELVRDVLDVEEVQRKEKEEEERKEEEEQVEEKEGKKEK